MPRITKQGWVMPHGNTKITSGQQASDLIFALNEERFINIAKEMGTYADPEKLKRIFASSYEMKMAKNPGMRPMDVIEEITRSRAFTTSDEMAFSNLRSMLNNSGHWREFLRMAGIKASEYDDSLWEYDEDTYEFTYNGMVGAVIGGNYLDVLELYYL